MFTGASVWPTTVQAFRIARSPESIIIASDRRSNLRRAADAQGLEERLGFGLEVTIVVQALHGLSLQDVTAYGAYATTENQTQNTAAEGGCFIRDFDSRGVRELLHVTDPTRAPLL